MTNLTLSSKQKLALDLLDDPTVAEMYWGGSAGSGKTLMVCIWMILQSRKHPGIRIGLGRKELTRLKQTTLITLLREAHPLLGVNQSEFSYQDQKGLITYINGSSIQLIDLARQPSDPDFDTFGSLNFTHIVIEEAGEVVKKAKDVLGSRKNRFMNKEYGLVGKTILTGNPSQNFTRDEFYEPYKQLGAGSWQKWPQGEVEVNGVLQPAYKAFIRALPVDNPFLPQNYIEVLRQLPPAERKRLLEGDWDYADDDNMLFKSVTIDRSMIGEIVEGERFMGVDVAREGKDRTIFVLIEGYIATTAYMPDIDTSGEKSISEQTAMEIIKFAQQNKVTPRNIGIDSIGVGAGVLDFMRTKGWFPKEYKAGASSPKDQYNNLRTESLWEMSQAMINGTFKIYSHIDMLDQLRKELMAHEYTIVDRTIKVEPKDKIKERIGYSPDISDALVIAHWTAFGTSDKRHNRSRLVF